MKKGTYNEKSNFAKKLKEHKNILMLVLVGCLFLGAVYLNVSLNQNKVNIGNVNEMEMDTNNSSDTESVENNGEDYFETFKKERDELRERELTYLDEIISASTSDDETLQDAKTHKMTLVQNMEKEFAIEKTVEAKGFNKAAVTFNGGSVSVIVDKESLSDKDVAKILDVVKSETGLEAKNIKIIPSA